MGKWCRCPSSLIDADRAVVGLRATAIALSRMGQQQFGCTLLAAVAVTMHDAVQFGAGQLRFNLFPVMRERRTTDLRPVRHCGCPSLARGGA
jgi:hypothetical protein